MSTRILFVDFDCENCKLLARGCFDERLHSKTGLNEQMSRVIKRIVRSSVDIYNRGSAYVWIALRPFSHGIHVELVSRRTRSLDRTKDAFSRECRKFLRAMRNYGEDTRETVRANPKICASVNGESFDTSPEECVLVFDVNASRFGSIRCTDDNNEMYYRITYVSGERSDYNGDVVAKTLARRKRFAERESHPISFPISSLRKRRRLEAITLSLPYEPPLEPPSTTISPASSVLSRDKLGERFEEKTRIRKGTMTNSRDQKFKWIINRNVSGNEVGLIFCKKKKPFIRYFKRLINEREKRDDLRILGRGRCFRRNSDNKFKRLRSTDRKSFLFTRSFANTTARAISTRDISTNIIRVAGRKRKFLLFGAFIRTYLYKKEPFVTSYFLTLFKQSTNTSSSESSLRSPRKLAFFLSSLILRDVYVYLVQRIILRLIEWLEHL